MDTKVSVNGNFTEFEGRGYILFTCPYLPPNGALHSATYAIYDYLTVGGRQEIPLRVYTEKIFPDIQL